MGSSCALYVAVSSANELRKLLPDGFETTALADTCAYGYASDSEWSALQLGELAKDISKTRDAIVMEYSSVTGLFSFIRFRAGGAVRALGYRDGWRLATGTPEPWEAELPAIPVAGADDPDFDAWTACDLAGTHYRLTGWFESDMPPAPRDPARDAAMKNAVEQVLADKRAKGERASTLIQALEANGLSAFRRELFLAHDEFFVLVDAAGAPYIERDRTCPEHGAEHALRVYTSKADIDAYMESYEAPILDVKPGARIDGAQILAIAAQAGASALLFNWLGEHYYGDYLSLVTLRGCRPF